MISSANPKELIVVRVLIQKFNYYLFLSAITFIFLAMVLTMVDTITRSLGKSVITGSIELQKYCLVIICTWCWAHTQALKGNIIIDALFERLSFRIQNILNVVTTIIALFIIGLFSWESAEWALLSFRQMEWTLELGLPTWLFKAMMALGALLLFLQLVIDLLDYVKALWRKSNGNTA